MQYRTEDGKLLNTGDLAYDYYSMKPGTIGEDAGGTGPNEGWFTFNHLDGKSVLLNGQRICTIEFARQRGFKDSSPQAIGYIAPDGEAD